MRVAMFAAAALWSLPGLQPAGAASQDLLPAAIALRSQGCDGHPGVHSPLLWNTALSDAAAQWSRGVKLNTAIERSGYRQDQSAGMHVGGTTQTFTSVLAQRLCAALTDPRMMDVGIFEHGGDTWLVIAEPFTTPAATAAGRVALQVLQSVNTARAQARRCGRELMAAAPGLHLNELLSQAALAHAQDMLRFGYFDHAGHDGSSPAQRIAATGYNYRLVGENIASGPETPQEAVQGWLSSPAHCQNLMDAHFTDMGIAYAASRGGEPHIYWVQEFAAAR